MNKEDKLNELKLALSTEIKKDASNNDLILSLSHEIANLSDDQVRFSIDSGVIDRLGRELVARQETAVSELVKNSYDADATNVTLTFNQTDKIGGTLIIEDDGEGMTRDELVNGFMRISSTNKIHNPYSKRYNRKRAGQKGIGRFAVQRIGLKLTIITQTEHTDTALKLVIDWNQYEGDTNLLTISNALVEIPKVKNKGTDLLIEQLRDKWSEPSIKRIYRYVSDIIQPYSLSETKHGLEEKRKSDTNDIGFSIQFIKINNKGDKKIIADDSLMIYDHSAAIIEGYIDQNGIGTYTIDSKKLDISLVGQIGNDPDDNNIPFNRLKDVRFRAYYFIYDPDLIPNMQSTIIRRLALSQGSIRLYRNGFRVLPYGEPSNDWLKLDQSVRTRTILPPHGNNNFFGFVELTDNENNFNETSSREGLTENEALIQLQNFIHRTLITGVVKVAEVRNTKITTNQQQDEEGNWEEIDIRIKNIAHTLEELDKELDENESSIEARKKRKRKIQKVKKQIAEIKVIQKNEQDKYIKEKSMLRVLSSVGLTIAQFIHEIKYYMDNIQSDIKYIIARLNDDRDALNRANILRDNFSTFRTYTSYFDNVVSQNVVRDLRPLDLRNVVDPFIKSIGMDASESGMTFEEPIYNNYRAFTKPMHPSEWSSILFNFYTNSKKAIKRKNTDGKILIECGATQDYVYLEFSDNGDGISKENEEKIFEEFYTTTSPANFESLHSHNEILGTGLGLKIVKDIILSYKGNVYVVSPKYDYSTCIRVEVPIATQKEIEKYEL